ncbi:hypothetical protein CFN78_10005 [Amycolatopsis antarctica]|uniref:Tat pathway signal protein n=1 Tax=Amycolatopsis antarctica TaxID=1854586 RepID=A0A263D581_9PSEU|nr:hypothetical protein [Amycolatopsis antarctica]OZM73198.1 hypothetical protein CFN78_10005 [Amycolatopsis antarctica]
MTDQNTPGGNEPPGSQEPPKRGSIRRQDESTTPREPSLAEQRARRKAEEDARKQAIADREAAEVADRKAGTKRKVLIGSGVTVGIVGLVAAWYAAVPEDVEAVCADNSETIADDRNCDEDYVRSQGGYSSGGFLFLPLPGGGYNQYRYNYGGTGTVGGKVSGGSYDKPSSRAGVTTKSGKSVQRGGFGVSGSSDSGKSGGS